MKSLACFNLFVFIGRQVGMILRSLSTTESFFEACKLFVMLMKVFVMVVAACVIDPELLLIFLRVNMRDTKPQHLMVGHFEGGQFQLLSAMLFPFDVVFEGLVVRNN